jgi:hypothetical protein
MATTMPIQGAKDSTTTQVATPSGETHSLTPKSKKSKSQPEPRMLRAGVGDLPWPYCLRALASLNSPSAALPLALLSAKTSRFLCFLLFGPQIVPDDISWCMTFDDISRLKLIDRERLPSHSGVTTGN